MILKPGKTSTKYLIRPVNILHKLWIKIYRDSCHMFLTLKVASPSPVGREQEARRRATPRFDGCSACRARARSASSERAAEIRKAVCRPESSGPEISSRGNLTDQQRGARLGGQGRPRVFPACNHPPEKDVW